MYVAEQMMGFKEDEAATSMYLSARIGSSSIAKAALVEVQKSILDFLRATAGEKVGSEYKAVSGSTPLLHPSHTSIHAYHHAVAIIPGAVRCGAAGHAVQCSHNDSLAYLMFGGSRWRRGCQRNA
jgi:hypothetical protein